jgi:hypothetical protein
VEAFSPTPRIEPEDHRGARGGARVNLKPRADSPDADLPPETVALIKGLRARLTELEARENRSLPRKLFGKGSVVAGLLAIFLISGSAWAYTGFGSGIKDCSRWVIAKKFGSVDRRARFHEWTNGYLTAYSLWVEHGSGPVSRRDSSVGAWAWIDDYCQENPLKSVAAGAEQLILAIKAD